MPLFLFPDVPLRALGLLGFSQQGEEESFAVGAVGQKTVNRQTGVGREGAEQVPLRLYRDGPYFGTELVTEVGNVVFVFLKIVRTCAVDKETAGLERSPYMAHDGALLP